MLTNIKLENFKCFRELDLKCAPLTLLTGVNGTGKSSVFQALLLLRQSADRRELEEARLALDGDYVDLGTPTDLMFDHSKHIKFELSFGDAAVEDWIGEFVHLGSRDQLEWFVDEESWDPMYVDPEEYLFGLRFGVSDFPIFSGNLIYVSAERIGPKKIYPLSVASAARKDLGNSGELAWNYLSVYRSLSLEEDDPRSQGSVANQLEDVTNLWLREVAPGTRLSLDDIPAADALTAGFSFVQPGNIATRAFRATNVGFGSSYTLPVIVAFLMPKNTLCLIENPEAHLHPSGQTKMAELAARAAKAGVQVMV